jgi:hypothetical protein
MQHSRGTKELISSSVLQLESLRPDCKTDCYCYCFINGNSCYAQNASIQCSQYRFLVGNSECKCNVLPLSA